MIIRSRWLLINIVSAALAVAAAAIYAGFIDRIEPIGLDLMFQARGPAAPPQDIVIVKIDEESYKRLGVSPLVAWPRERHIELLERLKEYGVKRVVFDLNFQARSENPDLDRRLAEAFKLNQTVIFTSADPPKKGEDDGIGDRPLPLFAESVWALGDGRVRPDAYGVVRWMRANSNISLAEAGAGHRQIWPGRPDESDYINYYGPGGTIKNISYYQVLDRAQPIPAEDLRGKIVFVGLWLNLSSAAAPLDAFNTPYSENGRTFGVELQATVAGNILSDHWLRRFAVQQELAGVLLAVFVLSLAMFSLKPQWAALVFAGGLFGWGAGAYGAFLRGRVIPGATACILILPLSFMSSVLFYYLVTVREQRRIKSAFGRYLTPSMVEEIARDPAGLELGGKLVDGTILFSDIAGFTSLAEKNGPAFVSDMLNRYFTTAADIVLENRGTLIKFIGDGMFVVWGAPVPVDGAPDLALKSALRIAAALKRLFKEGAIPELSTRFGIHCGQVIAGNLGSEKRFDYTAVGDAVNLASRLEQLNKQFGTTVLISGAVEAGLKEKYELLPLGAVNVAGKTEAIKVSTAFDGALEFAARESWIAGISAFCGRDWGRAEECFRAAASADGRLAAAAGLYLGRIAGFRAAPPPEGWGGEVVFESK